VTAGTSRVVFATDLHLADGHGGFEAFAADLEEIADLAPDLLVLGGDICLWDSGSGDRLQDLLRDLPVDTMSLLGNHDTDRDFADRFGTPNRCVELGG
jgi:predicted MPP superfamily phosphohydrolase